MAETRGNNRRRVESVDFLRGLVMVIMLLDHTREYVHSGSPRFSPTDLSKTTLAVFLTRWVTHLCAPTFVLLAGTSVYLQLSRGKSRAELSRFLITRGLWLVVLEFTAVRLAILFNFDYRLLGMAEVIWAIGVSMVVLAGLIHLPVRAVAAIGVALVALHNLSDALQVPAATAMAATPPPSTLQKLWLILHQPGFVPLSPGGVKVFVAYPLVPWVGVMAVGYALGVVYTWDSARRRAWLLKAGLALTSLFVLLRALNFYGDPQPWSKQTGALFTALSFLNTTKYPASLLFLLMTLGPALFILGLAEGVRGDSLPARVLITFGRVPLFYFVLQMFVAHGLGVLLGYLAGKSVGYQFLNFPASSADAPPDAGFPLWVVYAAWAFGLLLLYPLCVWYAGVKARRRGFPFSYL
jgi:uncharacterized membrane protein